MGDALARCYKQQPLTCGQAEDKLQASEMTPEACTPPCPRQDNFACIRVSKYTPLTHGITSTCPTKIRF